MTLLLSLLLQIAPLTEVQRTALDSARDGEDHQEAAFVALVEHVAEWPAQPGDVAIRIDPDLAALVADPGAARGDLCRVRGDLQQHVRLAAPHASVIECFLRDDAGAPILVYVYAPEGAPTPWARVGLPLDVPARFYKTVSAVDRRGREQIYPAFVGTHPLVVRAARPAGAPPLLVGALVALGLVFGGLLIYTRRQRGATRAGRSRSSRPVPVTDDGPPLPEDPADALEELRRRADAASSSAGAHASPRGEDRRVGDGIDDLDAPRS